MLKRVFLRRAAAVSPAKGMLPHGCALDCTTAQRARKKQQMLCEGFQKENHKSPRDPLEILGRDSLEELRKNVFFACSLEKIRISCEELQVSLGVLEVYLDGALQISLS